ncbi:MAG: hypothetical protein Q9191_004183, partial [Dirinaria sp. TL-2023a]
MELGVTSLVIEIVEFGKSTLLVVCAVDVDTGTEEVDEFESAVVDVNVVSDESEEINEVELLLNTVEVVDASELT